MINVKMVIAYKGTGFMGFQRQRGGRTIQGELESAVKRLTGEEVSVIGAGRTDAGAHARGQVVNFYTNFKMDPRRLAYALNSMLPSDIRVLSSEAVSNEFHARKSAKSKCYSYTILNRKVESPFLQDVAYWIRHELNVIAMRKALGYFIGQHDFSAFRSTGSSAKSTVRTVTQAELQTWDFHEGRVIKFWVEANGFLYNMVRIMAGTLIEVGLGKHPPEMMEKIIESRNRKLAGPTAPARGLCLEFVSYDKSLDIRTTIQRARDLFVP